MTLSVPEFIQPLLAQPVAVLGGGVSGRAVRQLVAEIGATSALYDERSSADGAATAFEEGDARRHGLVVFSPGFPPEHRWLVTARAAGCVCIGEVDFASVFWRGEVVAITGTNGKTTLTELLTHALKSIGRDACATGNIGYSFARLVAERRGGAPDSIAICEISSFQSEAMRYFRADAALWTNFAEDHLERHHTMESYFMAKWRLFERTIGGHVFAGGSVQRFAHDFGQTLPAEACVATEDQPGDVLLRGTPFADYPQRENFLLAAAWWRSKGLRETALYAAAQSFRLGAHRFARIAEIGGVGYWNDSKATNFHAVESAVASFSAPVLIILGGKPKGGDIAAFVRRIAPRVKQAFLIGETAPALADACRAAGVAHTVSENLAAAVRDAAQIARAGDHVLLSPAFASFDQFRNYEDRGAQFIALVEGLHAAPAAS